MTVIVSKPAVNLREELASLRNQGGYQEQQFYFDSLVTNGTFDADTSGWTASAGTFTSVSGEGVLTSGTITYAYQSFSTVVGSRYKATGAITALSGGAFRAIRKADNSTAGSNVITIRSSIGFGEVEFIATSTTTFIVVQLNGTDPADTVTVDNISVFEVDANDDVIHTMPKGWVPKDVYEDGLLQREGAAHDYEVVYDGFDYYVKPTVAPSATTQTCVIGVKA